MVKVFGISLGNSHFSYTKESHRNSFSGWSVQSTAYSEATDYGLQLLLGRAQNFTAAGVIP